jgi:hypothetical protein
LSLISYSSLKGNLLIIPQERYPERICLPGSTRCWKYDDDERKEKIMKSIDTDRRNFMKKAGGALIAVTAGSSLALSAMRAHAAQSAVT